MFYPATLDGSCSRHEAAASRMAGHRWPHQFEPQGGYFGGKVTMRAMAAAAAAHQWHHQHQSNGASGRNMMAEKEANCFDHFDPFGRCIICLINTIQGPNNIGVAS
jgi:hypothetical protein